MNCGVRVPCIRAGRCPSARCGFPPAWCGCARCGCATRRSGAGSGWPTASTWSRGNPRPMWIGTARHAISAWPSVCSGLRAEARKGRMLPYVIEVDGQFVRPAHHRQRHARRAAVGVDRLLGGQRGTGGGVATAAVALGLDHCFGPVRLHRVEATVRPENAASRARAGKGRVPRGGAVAALPGGGRCLARSPAGGHHRRGAQRLGGLRAGARGPRELGVIARLSRLR